MKALLPVYCRPLGYVILIVALFLPFILVMMGKVTDTNLLFYKECTKLLMIVGAYDPFCFLKEREPGDRTDT